MAGFGPLILDYLNPDSEDASNRIRIGLQDLVILGLGFHDFLVIRIRTIDILGPGHWDTDNSETS